MSYRPMSRYSGEMKVRYFLGAHPIAVRFQKAAPLTGDVVTLDVREYLVECRAVRINEVADRLEAFDVQVRSLG